MKHSCALYGLRDTDRLEWKRWTYLDTCAANCIRRRSMSWRITVIVYSQTISAWNNQCLCIPPWIYNTATHLCAVESRSNARHPGQCSLKRSKLDETLTHTHTHTPVKFQKPTLSPTPSHAMVVRKNSPTPARFTVKLTTRTLCLNLWFDPCAIITRPARPCFHLNRSKWTPCVFAYHCQLTLHYFVYSLQRYRSYCFTRTKMWENWPWTVQLISEPSSQSRPLPAWTAGTICHLVVDLNRMDLAAGPCRPHRMCSI